MVACQPGDDHGWTYQHRGLEPLVITSTGLAQRLPTRLPGAPEPGLVIRPPNISLKKERMR